jgi:hypothetical protein
VLDKDFRERRTARGMDGGLTIGSRRRNAASRGGLSLDSVELGLFAPHFNVSSSTGTCCKQFLVSYFLLLSTWGV